MSFGFSIPFFPKLTPFPPLHHFPTFPYFHITTISVPYVQTEAKYSIFCSSVRMFRVIWVWDVYLKFETSTTCAHKFLTPLPPRNNNNSLLPPPHHQLSARARMQLLKVRLDLFILYYTIYILYYALVDSNVALLFQSVVDLFLASLDRWSSAFLLCHFFFGLQPIQH